MMGLTLASVGLAGGGLIHLVLVLFFFCAVACVVWWAFTKLPIPEPIKTIALCVLLLIGLLALWQFTMGAV